MDVIPGRLKTEEVNDGSKSWEVFSGKGDAEEGAYRRNEKEKESEEENEEESEVEEEEEAGEEVEEDDAYDADDEGGDEEEEEYEASLGLLTFPECWCCLRPLSEIPPCTCSHCQMPN